MNINTSSINKAIDKAQNKALGLLTPGLQGVSAADPVRYRKTVDSEQFVLERVRLVELELKSCSVEDIYLNNFNSALGLPYLNRDLFNAESWVLFHSEKYTQDAYFQHILAPYIFSNFGMGIKTISRELSSGTIENCVFIKKVELYFKGIEKHLKLWEESSLLKIKAEIQKWEYIFFNSPDFKILEKKLENFIVAVPIMREREKMEQEISIIADIQKDNGAATSATFKV